MSIDPPQLKDYYAAPAVRDRIREFFGGNRFNSATALFFAPGTEWVSLHRQPHPLEELQGWQDAGAELHRSLWDRKSLLAHLDIEYVNFDFPARPYLDVDRIFSIQEPVVNAVESTLKEFGLPALHLLTGRGHHYVWRIERACQAFESLRRMGRMSESLLQLYASSPSPSGETVEPHLGAAFAGLSLIVEYLANRIKARAAKDCTLPLELAAVEAGAGHQGREIIALDITEYADPLGSRVIRVPFSIYLKPRQMRHAIGEETAERLPPLFLIPLDGIGIREGLSIRTDPEEVKSLATRSSTAIPEASSGMLSLIHDYSRSPLAKFHEWFYSQEQHSRAEWPGTYDRMPMDVIPPCVAHILCHPNDFLLRPACAARVVRVMLALGWHPRHIAGLIHSKYGQDHLWEDQWHGYDPSTRADFYARTFAGPFAIGTDDLIDFNCTSAREEGLCFIAQCNDNLARFRDSLINRRQYDRLGCRPFNRLLLSQQHP